MQVKVLQNPVKHSAILLTCIKGLSVLKTYFWSSFEWLLKTGFTVCHFLQWPGHICLLDTFLVIDNPSYIFQVRIMAIEGLS